MIKITLMAGAMLAATINANAQGVSACLADAASEYKRAWVSHCPGGFNYPCVLRPLAASEAKSDWASARSRCFEDNNAAAIDRADEARRGPELTQDRATPSQPMVEQPRGKFWISPQ